MYYNKNIFSVYFVLSIVLSTLHKPPIKAKLNNVMNSKLWFVHTVHGIWKKKNGNGSQIYSFNEYLLLFKSKISYDFLSAYYVQSWAKWFACAVVFKPLKQQEETGIGIFPHFTYKKNELREVQ